MKVMKCSVLFILLMVLILTLLPACAKPAPPAPAPKPAPAPAPAPAPVPPQVFKLKYTSTYPKGVELYNIGVDTWAKPLMTKSKGRIQFEFYGEGELVKGADLFRAIKEGMVDVGVDAWIYNAGTIPSVGNITWMPWLAQNPAQYHASFWYVVRPFFNDKLQEKFTQRALNAIAVNPLYLFTKKPVTKMEDLKGMKIRAQGGAPSKFMEGLGAAAVSMTTTEAITALQTGMLDGVVWSPASIIANKMANLLPYAVMQSPIWGNVQYAWNLKSWKALPADLQQLIEEHSLNVAVQEGAVLSDKRAQAYLGQLATMGVKFNTLSDTEVKRWRDVAKTTWDWFASQSPENKEIMDLMLAYIQ